MISRGTLAEIQIEKLTDHPANHLFDRIPPHLIELIAESIRREGLRERVIVNENLVILSGHKRVAALRLLGERTVPVIIRDDMDENQEILFLICENTTRNPISASHRIAIYRKVAPDILSGKVPRSRINEVAKQILISPNTILKDLQNAKNGKDLTLDQIRTAWTQARDRVRVNLIDMGREGFLLRVEGRNFSYESGPGEMQDILRDSLRKAESKHFSQEFDARNIKTGTDLKNLRKDIGMTQVVLAEMLGVSQSYYAELESGKHNTVHQYIVKVEEIAREMEVAR